jgi:hypothetical protein
VKHTNGLCFTKVTHDDYTRMHFFHQGLVHYQIKGEGVTWAQLFAMMEDSRERFGLDDYSVSQTTLEQVFITLALAQRK